MEIYQVIAYYYCEIDDKRVVCKDKLYIAAQGYNSVFKKISHLYGDDLIKVQFEIISTGEGEGIAIAESDENVLLDTES